MTLFFVDGMDAYSTGDLDPLVKWEEDLEVNMSRWSLSTSLGRFGGGAISVSDSIEPNAIFVKSFGQVLGDAVTTNELRMRFSFRQAATEAGDRPVLTFYSPADNYRSEITAALWSKAGVFQVTRGGVPATNIIATAPSAYSFAAWHNVELRAVFHDTNGLFQLWVDGVSVINVSSVDLDATTHPFSPTAGAAAVGIYGVFCTGGWLWDDIIIWNSAGTGKFSGTSQLGDVQIETLRPTAAGDVTGGTPSAGSNWAAVDDPNLHDGDTTYVNFGASGTYDLYNIANHSLSTPANIWGVAVNHVLRADGTTMRRARSKVKTVSTEYNGVDRDIEMVATYSMIQDYWVTNPNSGANWTIGQINALQIGLEARD
jgi:hypothetical protein